MLPCGTYNESYAKDIAIVRTRAQWGMLIAFLVVLFTAPLYVDSYALAVLSTTAIVLIAVQGLNILSGYCGLISIGQAAFLGVGAYISSILTLRYGVPWLGAFICAGLGSGLIGIIIGLPALRVKGFYLAIATLAAQFTLAWLFLHLREWTGGTEGLSPKDASIGGLVFHTEVSKYYLVIVICLIMNYLAKNLVRTRTGRALVAIRDNDIAAEVMGINIVRYKLLSFFICCSFAGVAGSLWAHYTNFISPTQFILADSILYLGMLIVGGLGSIMGAVFGTVLLKLLGEGVFVASPILAGIFPAVGGWLFAALTTGIYGIVIILFLIFAPRGLAHRWQILKDSYRLYPFAY